MNWFKRLFVRHLSTKLVLLILSLLLFSTAMISYFYYWSSFDLIRNNVRASTGQSAKQSADYLSLILTVGSDVGQQISHNERIRQMIEQELKGNLTVDEKYEIKESIDQTLNNVMYTSSFVRSVYVLKERGTSWGSGLFNMSKVVRYNLTEQGWYRDLTSGRAEEIWLALHYDPFSGGGENTELVLSLIKPLLSVQTHEALGVIIVNMDGKRILDAIGRIPLGKTGQFFVVGETGRVLAGVDPGTWDQSFGSAVLGDGGLRAADLQPEFETDIDGTRTYGVTQKLPNGWTVIGTVPVKEIIGDIQQIQAKIWLYASIFFIAASIVGVLFSRRITHPLQELMGQIGQVEKSNFTVRTQARSQDEIGRLSLRFNQMVRQIEMLIVRVNEEETKKREAEMRALRHQINPHFLYNTLTTIRWMVKFGQHEGAYNGISALVQLMEASMEKKGVFSTIGEELDLLDKYMMIQRFRYGANIDLQVDCDERLKEIRIPRMLLQPIVENAIFHGIAPKELGGIVRIHFEKTAGPPERLRITIADNGLGMPPDKIKGLLNVAAGDPKSGMVRIGLNHVHETIQLYYGLDSGVHIDSEYGKGTVITLDLRLKGDAYDDA